ARAAVAYPTHRERRSDEPAAMQHAIAGHSLLKTIPSHFGRSLRRGTEMPFLARAWQASTPDDEVIRCQRPEPRRDPTPSAAGRFIPPLSSVPEAPSRFVPIYSSSLSSSSSSSDSSGLAAAFLAGFFF